MAKIEFSDAFAGLGIGSTWGTADDLTSAGGLLHYESIVLNDSFGSDDVSDQNNVVEDINQLEQNVQVTITSRLQFHGLANQLFALWMGEAGAPTEQTASQGDYLHTIDFQDSNLGDFCTLAWKIEDDNAIEIPSLKIQSITIAGESNRTPVMTIVGVGDKWLYTQADTLTNTPTDLDGLTLPTVEYAVCNGSSLYFRLNGEASSALASGDDQEVVSWSLALTRDMSTSFPFRAAVTKYTTEPCQLNPAQMLLTVEYDTIDDADHDPLLNLKSQTSHKAELFFDGDQIGTGNNASYKFQIPRMIATNKTGYSPTRGQRLTAGVTYKLLKASSAPSGMTGVTNLRLELTNTRSTDLLAT